MTYFRTFERKRYLSTHIVFMFTIYTEITSSELAPLGYILDYSRGIEINFSDKNILNIKTARQKIEYQFKFSFNTETFGDSMFQYM